MSAPVSKVQSVRVSGPLASYAAGFRGSLADTGYTPLSAVVQLRLMRQPHPPYAHTERRHTRGSHVSGMCARA